MNEQVIKEAEELIELYKDIFSAIGNNMFAKRFAIKCAIKTQERVISELKKVYKEFLHFPNRMLQDILIDEINHNKEILNHLKTLI